MKLPSIKILDSEYTIHRYPSSHSIPSELINEEYYWIGKTEDESSIVYESSIDLPGSNKSQGWSCFKLNGPLDLTATGVLARISKALSSVGLSIFALSTFDTDYILVNSKELSKAISTLKNTGYSIE